MFENVVGHDAAKRTLSQALVRGHPAHAYFFVGPPQVGKRTLALAFAQSLLCPEPSPPCGICSTCARVEATLHPDLLILGQQERRGPRPDLKLEQVHDLQRMIGLAPFEGRCRVAIIDGAERLLNEAANALLKTLEEPPPSSYLLLMTEAEELVLPTIVSRCQRIVFGPVAKPLIADALVERWSASGEQAASLADHAHGRIGWAVEALADPVLLTEAEARLGALIRLLEGGLTARLDAAASLEQQAREDPEATLNLLAEWRGWWEGVLRAKGGLAMDDRRNEVATRISWSSVMYVIRATDATREQWLNNVSPLLAFEHLTLAIPALSPS